MKKQKTTYVFTGSSGSVNVLMAAAGAAALWGAPHTAVYIRNLGLFSILILISICDLRVRRIPNRCILAGIVLWACTELSESLSTGRGAALWHMAAGILAGSVTMLCCLCVRACISRFTGRASLGGGDLKLLFLGGLAAGPDQTPVMVFLSCIFGLLTAIRFQHRGMRTVPFGPAISVAIMLILLHDS